MKTLYDPIGSLWNIFDAQSGQSETVENEIKNLIKRLINTDKGDIIFLPHFGAVIPKKKNKNIDIKTHTITMKELIKELYEPFFRVHNYAITYEDNFNEKDLKDKLKKIVATKKLPYIKISNGFNSLIVFWNKKEKIWQLNSNF